MFMFNFKFEKQINTKSHLNYMHNLAYVSIENM